MLTRFNGRFGFGLLAAFCVIGAVTYGDNFWYLIAAIFVLCFVFSNAGSNYEIVESQESASVMPNEEDGESVVVSRVSRRRRA